ncbi:MAG: hypothetical protein MJ211_10590 [Bacteroidales bacterium]|nr:hypothetical protein [Bacteroidales bacterium]
MNQGRRICDYLKSIRQNIANQNGIEYTPSKCNFKGECAGTCPKCDAELVDLQNKINILSKTKRNITLAGIALSVSLTGCFNKTTKPQNQLEGDVVKVKIDSPACDSSIVDIKKVIEQTAPSNRIDTSMRLLGDVVPIKKDIND